MNSKHLYPLLLVSVLLIIIGSYLWKQNDSYVRESPVGTTTSQSLYADPKSPTINPTKPLPLPPPSNPPTRLYSMNEVVMHSTATSCWSVINGNVYDLTNWITNHPGGTNAILSLCGKDGTASFTGKHAGDLNPEAELKNYLIGVFEG